MKIDDITVCYGTQTVLSHFSLCLPQSGVVALMGPSGVGKTTLLRVMMGLEKPQSGTVEKPETPAYLFQEDRLLPWLTALGNVEAVLPKGEKAQAAEALRAMGLPAEAFAKRPEALVRRDAPAGGLGAHGMLWRGCLADGRSLQGPGYGQQASGDGCASQVCRGAVDCYGDP